MMTTLSKTPLSSETKELKLPVFRGQSPQLPLRRHFIDLLCVLASRFQLSAATRHLAVYLLDLFMDRYDIAVKQLYVAALSCLVLASKFEEREERVPKLDQLNNIGFMGQLPLRLGRTELRQMELLLLDAFQWNLCLPTAALFLDYYLAVSGPDADVCSAWLPGRPHKIYYYLEKYAQYFLEVSLQDHVYLRFYPSQVAAGCVAAARACLHLSPTWPPQFQRLTNYSWDHLAPCMELLLLAHDNDSKEAAKQSPLQQHSPRPQHICDVPFPNSPVHHHHSLHLPSTHSHLAPTNTTVANVGLLPDSLDIVAQHGLTVPTHSLSLQESPGLLTNQPRVHLHHHHHHQLGPAVGIGTTQGFGHVEPGGTAVHRSLGLANYPLAALQGFPVQNHHPVTLELAMVTDAKPFLGAAYPGGFKVYSHYEIPATCFER
uniref:Cyclin-J-like protein n=1 Tax=Eptatretus burgeri TaxID=7764 RepID=A0A8C4QKW1_EPTBU